MTFLFHTVIEWEALPVYYSIYLTGPTAFYAEVQDNPHQVPEAADFHFGQHWNPAQVISERAFDFLMQDVRALERQAT